jgi:hypothetical protein
LRGTQYWFLGKRGGASQKVNYSIKLRSKIYFLRIQSRVV